MSSKAKVLPPFYCEESFVDVILPADKIKADESNEWLIIGSPGVDGIEFRVKQTDDTAVFVYYPYEDENIKVADTPEELIEIWKAGRLKL
jgi:hypothetical protein